jgi:peptide deformylase
MQELSSSQKEVNHDYAPKAPTQKLINEALKDVLSLVLVPDERLNTKSQPVISNIAEDQHLQYLMNCMVKTMQVYKAVGLAAIQVGVPMRVIVVQDERLQPVKMINPVIKSVSGSNLVTEGCLSIPTAKIRIARPTEVVVDYFDETGKFESQTFRGLLAQAILHECKHLDGITLLDEVSDFQKSDLLKKVKSFKRKLK